MFFAIQQTKPLMAGLLLQCPRKAQTTVGAFGATRKKFAGEMSCWVIFLRDIEQQNIWFISQTMGTLPTNGGICGKLVIGLL